ncbi:hypothetical protein B0F90DRAFT_1628508 [Multifurca ochricompacta]|uniref:Uncharacterized protein n=1 Tax=Multifurca ochricompacta TaxID=376703 RepID=A0AAD4M4B6_9AGAM|nr:hypothetical protein B0F90DRAFT_1628508 [Multifurca ochricompacta]
MFAFDLFQKLSPFILGQSAQNALLRSIAYVSPVLRLLPPLAKFTGFLLVILNVGSLPFAWHVKVFWPVIKLRWLAWCARVRTLSLSSSKREAVARKFLDDLSPTGQNPLDKTIVTKAWASIDDCDYNWHLSNSSYPKILDSARMNSALSYFLYFARSGGWIGLAATHFHFLREIPMFARYEVRSQIVGWDRKWLYVVHRFVTHRKPSSRASRSKNKNEASAASGTTSKGNNDNSDSDSSGAITSASVAPMPAIHTPSTPLIGLTPSPSSTNLPSAFSNSSSNTGTEGEEAAAAAVAPAVVASALAATPEPDGATLHCVSVNVMVCKHGRITVPPALVLAAEGLGATPEQGNAARARALELGLRGTRKLYLGAWRDVPEGERWWDEAMKGLEGRIERRVRRLWVSGRGWRVPLR